MLFHTGVYVRATFAVSYCHRIMETTIQYLSEAAAVYKVRQGRRFSVLLLPDLEDPIIQQITQELVPVCSIVWK